MEVYQLSSLDYSLLAVAGTKVTANYFSNILQTIAAYDQEHGSDLMGTLMIFIAADGDLVQASKLLYQHANTVRYRVAKIKQLLEMESPNSYMELLYFRPIDEKYTKSFTNHLRSGNPRIPQALTEADPIIEETSIPQLQT